MSAPAPRCTCGHTEAQHVKLLVGTVCMALYCNGCKAYTPQTVRDEWLPVVMGLGLMLGTLSSVLWNIWRWTP